MIRSASLLVALLLALSACALRASPSTTQTEAAPTPSVSPSATPSASSGVTAGRPYGADEVLAAMRDSRRPGGVPDILQTNAIATSVADQLWTWSGEPWATVTIGGACGDAACSLDVAGTPQDVERTDQYSFTILPDSGDVQLTDANLQGLPASLVSQLDAVARDQLTSGELEGLALLAAAWLLPAQDDHYRLAYRSGGEEGAPGVDVIVDRAAGTVLSVETVA